MKYKAGYKYQLAEPLILQVGFRPPKAFETDFFGLNLEGQLIIKPGYAWDGSTGIPDTKENLAPSCGHDVEAQAMRMGLLPFSYWRATNIDYCRWCTERGSWRITTWCYRKGLDMTGGSFAKSENRRPILEVS